MIRRHSRLLSALAVIAGVGVATALLLWPSGRSQVIASSTDSSTLLPAAKRKPMPDLSGSALTPPPLRIALQQEGRPAFIDVWASWCIPCKEEAPMLAALHQRYKDRIRFLGIDVEDSRSAARAFERRYKIRYPSIFDRSASTATRLRFLGLPTAYLVDRRGRIAAVLVGKQRQAALRSKLERLVSERG